MLTRWIRVWVETTCTNVQYIHVACRVQLLGARLRFGSWVERAEGDGRLERVRLRQEAKTWVEQCDYAAVGYGLALEGLGANDYWPSGQD